MTQKKVYQRPTAEVLDVCSIYDLAEIIVNPASNTTDALSKPSRGEDDYEDDRSTGKRFNIWED